MVSTRDGGEEEGEATDYQQLRTTKVCCATNNLRHTASIFAPGSLVGPWRNFHSWLFHFSYLRN